MSDESKVSVIKDLRPGFKSINLVFIVIEIGKATKTKDGHEIRTVRVADKTGSINMSVWDDFGTQMQGGDIIRFTKGYSQIWKNQLTLYIGRMGSIEKIGEFCMLFCEAPNMSDQNQEFIQLAKQQLNEKTNTSGNPLPPPPPPLTSGEPIVPHNSPGGSIIKPPNNNQQRFHPYQRSNSTVEKVDPRIRRQNSEPKVPLTDPRQRISQQQQQNAVPAVKPVIRDPRRR